MTKEQVLADISQLIQDIDKGIGELINARASFDLKRVARAKGEMERLMVSAHQELTFLYDYIKEGGEQ